MSTREARLLDPSTGFAGNGVARGRACRYRADGAGQPTPVCSSAWRPDYLGMASGELTYPEIEAYMAIGIVERGRPGRISYRLGLRGRRSPSTPPAARRWWRSIRPARHSRLGECDLALAGGANVL